MLLRRLGGLVISMLLLQLNAASGDLACAKHSESAETSHHDAASEQATTQKADHAHGQTSPGIAAHDHEAADARDSCEIPAQRDCCQALASCSMTLGLTGSSSVAGVAVAHFAIAPPADEAPSYLILAPELPPPKA